MDQADIDTEMMCRCIALSATASRHGDLPIACLVCDGEHIVAEAVNRVRQQGDVTRHAELIAISDAQRRLKRRSLKGLTLYTTVEPCPMCSFPIRETGISRVVFAISSPIMGGVSKWNILRDTQISETVPEIFGPVPEIVAGMLWSEAAKVWWRWNPMVWAFIRHRGCFGSVPDREDHKRLPAGARRGLVRSFFYRMMSRTTCCG
jgi:tRNA(adenine34) deaminase